MAEPAVEQKTTFSDYALLNELSRGSLGHLYLARHSESGERVLLRVGAADLDEHPELKGRLREDLRRLSNVEHPAVAATVDQGELDGQIYYALRYPGSTTLLQLVRRGRTLVGDELLWLAAGVGGGLRALHKAGLFHGDLWPGKIAITPEGPVIVELGWARRFRDPDAKSTNKEFVADWRGLAASLVFAATGRLPATSGEGSVELPGSWGGEVGLPDDVVGAVDALLGSEERRPSLKDLQEIFLTGPKMNPSDSVEQMIAAMSEPGSEHETAVLQPMDSDEIKIAGGQIVGTRVDLQQRTEDHPIPQFASKRALVPPPKTHRLREGLEVSHKRVLGRGGMGVVYLVLDPNLGREAALKLVRGVEENPNRVARFVRETKVTSRLDHPGVPPVYEAGRTYDGQDYLLMQYVEGESLQDIIQGRRRMQPNLGVQRDLLHALVKVAETVAYAHSRRIVHRDLKPANIMIGAFGEVFLMDWGLARDLTETNEEDKATCSGIGALQLTDLGHITQDGMILGTPGYIPPEQAYGEDIDPRADVFSLGAVLVEILTGKPPIVGGDVIELVELTRAGQIELPRQRDREISPELDAIASTAMAFDVEDRYPSAQAMAGDLQSYLEGRNVSVYSYKPQELLWRWIRRHATFSASVAIALLLSVVAAIQVGRVRAEQREERYRQCQRLSAKGEIALREGKVAQAREFFVQALGFEPTNPEAVIGKHEADKRASEAREAELQRRRDAADLEKARGLIARGNAHMEKGELEAARRSFEQALALENTPPEAGEGLVKVKTLLAEQGAREDVRRQNARDARKAKRYLTEGKGYMRGKNRDYEKAQVAFTKAAAFGSAEAREFLVKNEELLLEQRLKERQQARKRRDASYAARLVKKAQKAEKADRWTEAKTAFLQALAFQGDNEGAQQGLVRVDRALQSRQSARDRRKRIKSANTMRKRGKKLMDLGRNPPDSPNRDARALEAYFAALVAFDRALAFVPGSSELREEKLHAVREVATFLRERGHIEFAEFLLSYGGAKPDEGPTDVAIDETLTFQEVDQVTIRNAFGGGVRFTPTRVESLPKLRFYLKTLKDRYRVLIQVRTKASDSKPPKVLAIGVWLRVEDSLTRTVYPMVKLSFETARPRRVMVSAAGRVVDTFTRALGSDLPQVERQIIERVRRLVEGEKE